MKTILAWTLLLTGVGTCAVAAGNQVLLRTLNPADGLPQVLASDSQDHLFVISTVSPASGQQTSKVVELDLNGSSLASLDIPQLVYPTAAVTDAQGNLIVAGQNTALQGIILKLDPQLHNVLFSTSMPATIKAVAVDVVGNIYVTGSTSSASFPVTAGAYQSKSPAGDNFGNAVYAFVTEISLGGDQLVYSTYFGSDGTTCNGGSFCIGKFGGTVGTTIAVDASGAVVIAGTTTANSLPTTPGVLATTCTCGYYQLGSPGITSGFIAKFQPGAARQLQWSTFLNGADSPISVTVTSLTLDSSHNVIVGGSAPSGLPTTPGALQPSVVPPESSATAFLVKLNSTGTAAIWGTYFGTTGTSVQVVRVDSQQRVVFSGRTIAHSIISTYVARLTSDGSALIDFYKGQEIYFLVGPALTLTASGGFASMSQSGALWIETETPGPSLLSVTNSANGQYSSTLTGVELITLGVGIGPQTPLPGQVQNGVFTTSLGGCQVLFDDRPALLLYADSGQINAVVPRSVAAASHLTVVTSAGTIDGPIVLVSDRPVPGIFQNSHTGLAAALNQDGSINSPSNPAKGGSFVAVSATGGARTTFRMAPWSRSASTMHPSQYRLQRLWGVSSRSNFNSQGMRLGWWRA